MEELYAIVVDVDRYREFLPYCVDSRVLGTALQPSRPKEADGATSIVDAELTIGFAAIRESYVSEVRSRVDEWVKVCALRLLCAYGPADYGRQRQSRPHYLKSSIRSGALSAMGAAAAAERAPVCTTSSTTHSRAPYTQWLSRRCSTRSQSA